MKKKRLTLLISAIVVALLCAAVIILIKTKPTDDAETSSGDAVSIISLDGQVESLDIENENGSYSITLDETAASNDESSENDSEESTEDDRQWKIEDLTGISQYQSMYSDIVALMTDLSADSALSSPGENSIYGLDQPAKATAYYSDGSSLTLLVGDMTPDESGYYCKLAEDDTVYVISSDNGAKFLRSILDYVDLTVTPTVETTTYTTVDSSDGDESAESTTVTTLNVSEIAIKISGKEDVIFTASDNELVRNGEIIDADLSSQLLSIISSISADSAAAIFPTDSQKEEYGFNTPTAVISYTVGGENYTLTIGNSIESKTDESQELDIAAGIESYYVMINGTDVVFVVGKDYLPWLNMDFS